MAVEEFDSGVLAHNVRELRTARGWSQEKLARESELSREVIRKIEAGTVQGVRLSTVWVIAGGLGVGVDRLLGYDDGPSTDSSKASQLSRSAA